ncbi:unnamed protein product [Microthlaspi erraticum]|uniref:DUF1985 domain-containing protein n=1 Tax=Microthlaspi erraticum TaxID=1685480 RepID=A0A6D2KHM5_9BRAS|nr:unnamed protein product [Microthlaspi erraticum]
MNRKKKKKHEEEKDEEDEELRGDEENKQDEEMRSIMMTMMARKIDNLHNSRKKFLNRIKPHRKNHFNRNKQKTLKQCLQMHMSLLLQRSWYSIKEHALLSGLDCHDYPSNYGELKDKDAGDFKFVEKWFKRRTNITIADVKKKLPKVKSAVNKKKMAALYFLTNVLKAKSKYKGNIEPFFLKVVDDLDLCEKFPWGRLTFDDLVDEVKKVAKKFKGGVVNEKDSWTFSGYILPIEAFAYECIPALARTFREPVHAESDCPRLCKHNFKATYMKGYPLSEINEAIGSNRDIISILEPTSEEETLMERIIDPGCDDGIGYVDHLVDLWRNHLIVQKKKIWWESLYKIDLAGRGITEFANEVPMQAPDNGGSVQGMMETMKALIEEATKKLEDKMDDVTSEIKAMVGDLDERLDMVECYVNEQRTKKAHDRSGASSFPLGEEEEAEEEAEEEEEEEQVVEPPKKRRKETPAEKEKRTIRPSAILSSPYVAGQANRKRKGKTSGKGKGGAKRPYNTRRKQG